MLFGTGVSGVTAEPSWAPFTVLTSGSHYALGIFFPGAQKTRIIYKQAIAAWGTPNNWTKLLDLSDGVVDFAVHGDDLYLVSQRNAPHRQVLITKLSNPDLRNASVLVPQGASVIEDVAAPPMRCMCAPQMQAPVECYGLSTAAEWRALFLSLNPAAPGA